MGRSVQGAATTEGCAAASATTAMSATPVLHPPAAIHSDLAGGNSLAIEDEDFPSARNNLATAASRINFGEPPRRARPHSAARASRCGSFELMQQLGKCSAALAKASNHTLGAAVRRQPAASGDSANCSDKRRFNSEGCVFSYGRQLLG